MKKTIVLGALFLTLLNCVASAGPKKIVVVELFTSEGCSSCPPAEERLSGIVQDPSGQTIILPIEWHVDYWDYLGWKDPFGSSQATNRQYNYAKVLPSQVYTPEIVVNGRIEAKWFNSQTEFNTFLQKTEPSRTNIEVDLTVTPAKTVNDCVIKYKIASHTDNLRISALLIESGLSSKPTSGENSSAFLKHTNVVRHNQDLPTGEGEVTFAIPPTVKRQNAQIVFLVQNRTSNEIYLAQTAKLPAVKQADNRSGIWKGRLVDASGKAKAGVQVQACGDQKCIPTLTDKDGYFSFFALASGPYSLTVGTKINALNFTIKEGQTQEKIPTLVLK